MTRAESATVRIDSSSYFRAFMAAALTARESILVLGWDFHSRTQLLCEDETLDEDPAAPRLLGDFLNYVASRRRGLRIRILIWDFPSVFGIEREFPFFYGTAVPGAWQPHRRIQVRFDSSHRFGGSHHQKVVVVDDRIAFCGGIDLTRARWDTCEHRAGDERRFFDGKPYAPVHDVTLQVQGETARVLGHLARRRWRRAGGPPLLPGPRLLRRALDERRRALQAVMQRRRRDGHGVRPLPGARIAVSRTYAPGVDRREAVREVEALFIDMIRAARRYILIENQYFTAEIAGRALEERLREPNGPEVVVVVRLLSHGWLEELTMERMRTQLIRRLRAIGGEDRVRVYYPHVEGLAEGLCVDVHSKLMIVDDRYLRIGSANFANRSMGLDTECDLTLEATSDADQQFVRETTARLLAEHVGCDEALVLKELSADRGLIAALDRLPQLPDRRLVPLTLGDDQPESPALLKLARRSRIADRAQSAAGSARQRRRRRGEHARCGRRRARTPEKPLVARGDRDRRRGSDARVEIHATRGARERTAGRGLGARIRASTLDAAARAARLYARLLDPLPPPGHHAVRGSRLRPVARLRLFARRARDRRPLHVCDRPRARSAARRADDGAAPLRHRRRTASSRPPRHDGDAPRAAGAVRSRRPRRRRSAHQALAFSRSARRSA